MSLHDPRQQAQIVNALPVRNLQAEALMLRLADAELRNLNPIRSGLRHGLSFTAFA